MKKTAGFLATLAAATAFATAAQAENKSYHLKYTDIPDIPANTAHMTIRQFEGGVIHTSVKVNSLRECFIHAMTAGARTVCTDNDEQVIASFFDCRTYAKGEGQCDLAYPAFTKQIKAAPAQQQEQKHKLVPDTNPLGVKR